MQGFDGKRIADGVSKGLRRKAARRMLAIALVLEGKGRKTAAETWQALPP